MNHRDALRLQSICTAVDKIYSYFRLQCMSASPDFIIFKNSILLRKSPLNSVLMSAVHYIGALHDFIINETEKTRYLLRGIVS